MRPLLFVASAALLAGCPSAATCGLEGDYVGTFSGDEEGSIEISVAASEQDGRGDVDFHMVGPNLELFAQTGLDCSTGSIVLSLEDASGAEVGDGLGSMGTLSGSGQWSLFSGTQGVWQY